MSDKMKFDFEKKVYWSINSIENLHQETAYRIIENDFPINNSIATIEKDPEKGFTCKIFLEDLYDYTYNQNAERFGIFEPIKLESTGDNYFINKNSAH